MLKNEIERLTLMLKQKDDEIEEWKRRYAELEEQGVTVIQERVTTLTDVS